MDFPHNTYFFHKLHPLCDVQPHLTNFLWAQLSWIHEACYLTVKSEASQGWANLLFSLCSCHELTGSLHYFFLLLFHPALKGLKDAEIIVNSGMYTACSDVLVIEELHYIVLLCLFVSAQNSYLKM